MGFVLISKTHQGAFFLRCITIPTSTSAMPVTVAMLKYLPHAKDSGSNGGNVGNAG